MEKTNEQTMRTFVLTGPESTGKTWLSELLAKEFKTDWCPEYLREFFEQDPKLTPDKMAQIAKEQIKRENEVLESKHSPLFFDTNIISLKIYHEYYFKQPAFWFEQDYQSKQYDYYFLLDTSVPWIADSQRDSEQAREELFLHFKNELDRLNVPYSILSGDYSARRDLAIELVTKLTEI